MELRTELALIIELEKRFDNVILKKCGNKKYLLVLVEEIGFDDLFARGLLLIEGAEIRDIAIKQKENGTLLVIIPKVDKFEKIIVEFKEGDVKKLEELAEKFCGKRIELPAG